MMKFLCGNFNSKIIIWSREASKCFNSSIVVHYEVFRICPSTQGMIRLLNSTLCMPALHPYYSFCMWSHHGGRWSTPSVLAQMLYEQILFHVLVWFEAGKEECLSKHFFHKVEVTSENFRYFSEIKENTLLV